MSSNDDTAPPETSFVDRLLYFIQLTNPIHIITSESQVKEAQFILSCKDKTGLSAEKVKHYESVIEACVHPASGDIIPPLARVGAIAPVNIPLILGMLLTPPSNVKMTLFLHWANQSYNSLCNYAHRSAKEFDMDAAGKAYTLAVGSACGFAYGLGKLACGLIYCAMQFALPAALAVFPSTSKLPVTSLEPQFQGLKDSKNLDIKYLYASKGL